MNVSSLEPLDAGNVLIIKAKAARISATLSDQRNHFDLMLGDLADGIIPR
jgi:hypothetical protein